MLRTLTWVGSSVKPLCTRKKTSFWPCPLTIRISPIHSPYSLNPFLDQLGWPALFPLQEPYYINKNYFCPLMMFTWLCQSLHLNQILGGHPSCICRLSIQLCNLKECIQSTQSDFEVLVLIPHSNWGIRQSSETQKSTFYKLCYIYQILRNKMLYSLRVNSFSLPSKVPLYLMSYSATLLYGVILSVFTGNKTLTTMYLIYF